MLLSILFLLRSIPLYRYFTSHTGKVDFLKMCPNSDTFMSGSGEDGSFRLWDVRSTHCQGWINTLAVPRGGSFAAPSSLATPSVSTSSSSSSPSKPLVAAFEPVSGFVFAVGSRGRLVKLYDIRTFDKAPFCVFELDGEDDGCDWHDLQFSPDGRLILISTASKVFCLM
jgi:COMPASS component SWD2